MIWKLNQLFTETENAREETQDWKNEAAQLKMEVAVTELVLEDAQIKLKAALKEVEVEESDKLEDMKLDAAKAEVEATKEVLKRTEMAEAANKPVENELTKQLQTGQKK
ncbi:hypothetical protein LR48_Vigan01g079100 [Vigna angularis]|uniref:Uncharacterized protein n=1 Tax=Phaseolus angularis TaxID=3914 RepID=A0A0L9TL81_PHAAN|nr:hypothetical protein LR48_Vigan01g079100 [Vigna angularis]